MYLFKPNESLNNIPETKNVDVVATLDDKITNDIIWCATFQLIWNDMKKELGLQNISFEEESELIKNLNKEDFTEDMISDEYYFKIYGLKTLELKHKIEKEIKKKFNQESDILNNFNWNNSNENKNYFFYTMLYRTFEYKKKFSILNKDKFGEYDDVKYFGIDYRSNNETRKQIEVLFYNSENSFAIKIKTKNNDEVIFYKNPIGNTFNEIYNNLLKESKKYSGDKSFNKSDKFKAPMIELNIKKEYTELENKVFWTSKKEKASIENAVQTIKFSLDEKGGKIKSEAAIDIKLSSAEPQNYRYFYLDNTFALFIKETKKDKPYLALKISDITKFQNQN